MNEQEIILAQISAIYDKTLFVKKEIGQMKMILKCAGIGEYYEQYSKYLEAYYCKGGYKNENPSYKIFLGLDSIFEDLLRKSKGIEILKLLTELAINIPRRILQAQEYYMIELNKLCQLYNLLGLEIVFNGDAEDLKLEVKPYLNEETQMIQTYGMEKWLYSKYSDVYSSYESALNSFSAGDLGAAIESCRTTLTGIFSKYKGVPYQTSKWLLGLATETGDFAGTQPSDVSQMTPIKKAIEDMGKKDIADFFEENLNGSYKKTKAIYAIYSMLSDYGTHRMEGIGEIAKNEDALMMIRMTTDILVWIYQKHGISA